MAVLVHTKTMGQSNEYSEFKAFLSPSRQPIEYVKLARSKVYYYIDGFPAQNDVLYEASLQTNTYFIKEIGNLFDQHITTTAIAGMSYDNYWYINENHRIAVASRDPQIAGADVPINSLNKDKCAFVEETLNLGIVNMDRSTISWSNNEFTAQSRENGWGTISGRITGGNGIAPKSLEYSFSSRKEFIHVATYYYDADPKRPDWLPHYISTRVQESKSKDRDLRGDTNTIYELKFGDAKTGTNGYDYTDFYSGNLANGNLVVYSNGVGNLLMGTNIETIRPASPDDPLINSDNKWKVKYVFFGALILSVAAFGWHIARCQPNRT